LREKHLSATRDVISDSGRDDWCIDPAVTIARYRWNLRVIAAILNGDDEMSQLALLVDDVVVSIFPLDKPSITIGRDAACDIQIDESSVSGSHARIEIKQNEFLDGHDDIFLEDLGSTNVTRVNDEKIDRCQIKPDDVIEIGWNKFKLVDDSQGNRQTTAFIGRV